MITDVSDTRTIDPGRLCVWPPCRGPRKCWQYDYCWYYADPPEHKEKQMIREAAQRNRAALDRLAD